MRDSACDHAVSRPLLCRREQRRGRGKGRGLFQLCLSIVRRLVLHRLGFDGSLLVRLPGSGRLVSSATRLQQSIHLRFGARDNAGGVLRSWLFDFLPAAIVHRVASRGRCGHCWDYRRASAIAIAADGAGGLGRGEIGHDDGRSGGGGWRQRRADVMGMLQGRWKPTVGNLTVALLVLR